MVAPSLRSSRILVIDDEAEVVESLCHILEEDGYAEIERTTDPTAAVDLCKRFQPDLVILDLLMPAQSGWTLLAELQALTPSENRLSVLVLTGETAIEIRRAALSQGASDFVVKPFDRIELLARIANLLETRFQALWKAEDARRESEERFFQGFEHAPIGVALVSPEGRWLKVNRALCDMLGYAEAEMCTRNFQEGTHPDDLAGNLENLGRMIAGETHSYQSQKRYFHRDGHLVTVLLNVSLVRGDRGEARYFITQIQDITERQHQEEVLRASEERFAGAFEHAPIGVALVSLQGRWLIVNRALCDLVGYSKSQLLTRTFQELTHPEDLAADLMYAQRVLSGEIHSYQMEKRYIHARGFPVAASLNVALVRNSQGQPQYFIAQIQDIRARKHGEEIVQRLAAIVDSSDDAILSKTLDGIVTSWNPAAERMFGYSAEEIIGRPLRMLVPPDRLDEESEILAGILTGEPVRHLETVRIRKNGQRFDVAATISPIKDVRGNVVGASKIVRDITARKRVERELSRSRETLRGILDHLPQRVFWKDVDLVYLGCNQPFAEDMGMEDPSQVVGRNDFDANWKTVAERYRTDDREVIDSGRPKCSFEEPGIAPDGRLRWLRTSKSPLRDQEGRVIGLVGTYEDVTEHQLAKLEIQQLNANLEQRVRERTEELLAATEEADRANRAKSEFLSRSSHELRTPLNAILGFGQLLAEEKNLGAEARESVTELLAAGSHLLALIDKVLDISNADAGRLVFTPESVAGERILQEMLLAVQSLAESHQVALEYPAPPERSQWVLADPDHLRQVLTTLLSNAIQYNRPGGTVTISCGPAGRPAAPAVRFRVKDTGPGLSAEKLERLFAPFDRLDAERARNPIAGSGLGLAMSKRLIELMGGHIGVESTVDEGSTFWIDVPRAKLSGTAIALRASLLLPEADAPALSIKRVLYVEGQLSSLRLIARMVARRPAIHLLAADSAPVALEMAAEQSPDLILLDPSSLGEEADLLLRKLGADPRTAEIPMVLLSADESPAPGEQIGHPGVRARIGKPVAVRALLAILDRFLAAGEEAPP